MGFTYVLNSGVPPADAEILSWFGLSPWFGFGVIIWLIFFVVFFLISFAPEGGGRNRGGKGDA